MEEPSVKPEVQNVICAQWEKYARLHGPIRRWIWQVENYGKMIGRINQT